MLTPTELKNILDQVNARFDYLNKRIDTLEAKLDKPTPKRTTTNKKVEEEA